ncbi:hypothetical protein BD769DRAFT_1482232 [Suillus cothurnatus]|nr:hypothetical protein BD769DRAFT_1482232 [Suillus cothurnatus]
MRARRLKATSLLVFFPLLEWPFRWTSTATSSSSAAKKPILGRKQTLSVSGRNASFASSICVLGALACGTFALQSSPTVSSTPDVSNPRIYTSAISSVIAAVTPMLALIYFCPLYLLYRHSKRHPRSINKISGARVQQYGPRWFFILIPCCLVVADATWLLLQFRFNNNAPDPITRSGVRFLLFSACWTTVTSGTYTLFFLDPLWSRHPIASIGTQAIWVLVTWVFWVAGAGLFNKSLPRLFMSGSCDGVVYCGQLQMLFGYLTLTFGMLVITWLVWQSARSLRHPMVIRVAAAI